MPSSSKFLGSPDAVERLTPRERECLQLVSQHLSSKEIARQLRLSQHTIDGHLDEARRKLGASTRRDAVRILLESDAGAPPRNSGGQFDETDNALPTPPAFTAPPPTSGGQLPAVAAAPSNSSAGLTTGQQERADELPDRTTTGPAARLWQGAVRHELTPPQRLAAIVLIAVVSALVLLLLITGARELTFLIQAMTEGR